MVPAVDVLIPLIFSLNCKTLSALSGKTRLASQEPPWKHREVSNVLPSPLCLEERTFFPALDGFLSKRWELTESLTSTLAST